MNRNMNNIGESVIAFKDIAKDLHSKNNHLSFDTVVNALLNSKYGHMVSEISLEEIGYIFDTTRQAIQLNEASGIKKLINPTLIINKESVINLKNKQFRDFVENNEAIKIQLSIGSNRSIKTKRPKK